MSVSLSAKTEARLYRAKAKHLRALAEMVQSQGRPQRDYRDALREEAKVCDEAAEELEKGKK